MTRRAIHLARLDKPGRPAVVMTRDAVRGTRDKVTVVPITETVRGLATEVAVGRDNGLDKASVANVDNIVTIPVEHLGRFVGLLTDAQEEALADAVRFAFDLE